MASKESPIALSLLSLAHTPDTAATIYTERVLQRPLHLKPTEPQNTAQHERRHKRNLKLAAIKKKHKPAPLSARQKRALCLYDIPKSTQKYCIYEPLHRMWVGYMQEILWENGFRPVDQGMLSKILSADFHGADVEVVRSRCVSRVGVKGIVVRDTRGVLEVVTKSDKLKIIPKEGTVFRVSLPIPQPHEGAEKAASAEVDGEVQKVIFELHGNQFQFRAADRANKKFKSHFLPDL